MRHALCLLAVSVASVPGLVAVVPAQPRPPAALVIETSGSSQPALQPYTEIAAGDAVTLASGSRLLFLHYITHL